MTIPPDYQERVYAGVLGKLIGVYLGRPIEGWAYEKIMEVHGEVDHYLPGRFGAPLVVTDDDITGTFTFLRALADHDFDPNLTPAQIGGTWLNYAIDRRTIFWWGGFGNSTEHTAYLRLKHGIPAPESGSIALNGKIVAEQIGSQIFIDGWAMIAPGDPVRAADFARRAASVSHDGEAIYGAQVVAAMEAQAFVESDIQKLIETGLSVIPRDSIIARLIHDVRDWHAAESDWRKTRLRIVERYGYDRYGGNCHMVPNHALIIHSLLHGGDDFRKSLMIVNTSGWDTDCNSGNVGCLLGIKNGLRTFAGDDDWRGPIADRLYLSTADGGRAITDAAAESLHIVNAGRALANQPPIAPKSGARFHFEFPGSVQGFESDPESDAATTIQNVEGRSRDGHRTLAISYNLTKADAVVRIASPTFIPPEAIDMPGYQLYASPTLYAGQTLRARVEADSANSAPVLCRLVIHTYGDADAPTRRRGPIVALGVGTGANLSWRIPDTAGQPIFAVGLEISSSAANGIGTVYLDYLTWDGAPDVTLDRPAGGGELWRRAWVDAVDQWEGRWKETYRIVKNEGVGLISQGTADWTDYRVGAPVTIRLAKSGGLAARVGGLRRYYALLLDEAGTARLVKCRDLTTNLAIAPFPVERDRAYGLSLELRGARIVAAIDGDVLFDVEDTDRPLTGGGVALVVEDGCLSADAVRVRPL
ncbi:MAG TPA: ADP-ribosylglycohydrolase family protein [Thermomicrobiales bacterium]